MKSMEDLLKRMRSGLTDTSSALLDWKASYLALSSIVKGIESQARAQNKPVITNLINKYKDHIDVYLQKAKDDIEQAEKIMEEEWKILESVEHDSTTMMDCLCEPKTT